ncbi:ribonuclease H-like domain-containing protein [Tanacetum coccineum]
MVVNGDDILYPYNEFDDGGSVNYEGDNFTLISKLDLSHPLHLPPNDFASFTLISVKLKGTKNYSVWSCAMHLALEGNNKISFIDDTCRMSNADEVLGRQWDRVNIVVLGLMGFDALVQLPRCTCHADNDFKKHNQLMKLMQFLMGLNDTYMQTRSNILSREPLSAVRGAYAIGNGYPRKGRKIKQKRQNRARNGKA